MIAALRWFSDLLFTNPVAVRLVQNASRRARHMYVRSAYLAVLIVALLILLLNNYSASADFLSVARAAAASFQFVAYLQLGLICVLSPVFMAGAIANESNPRTWEILLTTPMNALQIVLGQFLGRVFFVLALLLASLPLFAITQYFGGVPAQSVLLSYVVSAGAAVIVGAIAIALAVNRLAGRRAVLTFYVAVVSYLGITLAIDSALRSGNPGGVTWMTPVNPFLALRALLSPSEYATPDAVVMESLDPIRRVWFGSPVMVWTTISFGLAAIIVALSAINVRSVASRSGVRRAKRSGPAGERYRDARSVSNNPVAWRESTARNASPAKTIARWVFIAVGMLFGLGIVAYYHGGRLSHDEFRLAIMATVLTELTIVVLVAINTASTAISREREDGTLDLLLTTPLTPKQYLNGKLLGVLLALAPMLSVPLATAAFASVYTLAGGFGRQGGVTDAVQIAATPFDAPVVLPETALLLPLSAIGFLGFVVMVGLQSSLRSKGTIGSVVSTVALVGSVGGIIGACGWQAAQSLAVAGPALSALNPVSLALVGVNPESGLGATIDSPSDLDTARFSLAVGAAFSAAAYAGIIFALRGAMVNSFDVTTRKLAGNK